MHILVVTFILLITSLTTNAEEAKQAEVMVMGTFHFTNPGLDVVKNQQINITTDENQTYLKNLSQRIAQAFAPTHILLECEKSEQQEYQNEFDAYSKNNFTLPVNENYQLGFRIAKAVGNTKVICFDERKVGWEPEAMFAVLEGNAEEKATFDHFIAKLTNDVDELHKTKTLAYLLKMNNDEKWDTLNKSFYIRTNHLGTDEQYEGADAAASWWHRNFRMYANIQRTATQNTRVFVLAGQGHTSILKDLLKLDPQRTSVDVMPLF